jgi:uncharacterized protein
MKTAILLLLTGYQQIVSPLLHQLLGQKTLCRYEVSCSNYAKTVIQTQGVHKGIFMAVRRLLSCQPFIKSYASV